MERLPPTRDNKEAHDGGLEPSTLSPVGSTAVCVEIERVPAHKPRIESLEKKETNCGNESVVAGVQHYFRGHFSDVIIVVMDFLAFS